MAKFNLKEIIRTWNQSSNIGLNRAQSITSDITQKAYLAKILALYTEWEWNSEIWSISYYQLLSNTSLNDQWRKSYIQETLQDFRHNPKFGALTDEQIEWIIKIHHKYANTREFNGQWEPKTFFELSKQDRINIKKDLANLGINKNRQDLLVYHGICSRAKAFFILLLLAWWIGWYLYRSGATEQASPTPAPVITPEMYADNTKMPLRISPEELVRGIADSVWIQWITTDTLNANQRFLTVIDPTKGQWWMFNNFKRDRGISTAEFDNIIHYIAQMWYTMNDIDRMEITGDLDDSKDVSTITISWLPCVSFPMVTATNRTIMNETDYVDFTDDNLIRNLNLAAWDSTIACMTKRALPAIAFHRDDILGNVWKHQGIGLSNLYFWWAMRLWDFPQKTVIINFKFNQKMPLWNENRKNWPFFVNNIDLSAFQQYMGTPAGATKEIIITVVKGPWEKKFRLHWQPIITSDYTPKPLQG